MLLRSLAVIALIAAYAPAQDPIRFGRTPDISPDGKLVVFSYLGDLWTVEAIGGVARPVTMHEAHDFFPCFSPDGRRIAFSSNRHGQYDVYVVPVQGGRPTRLTFDSGHDYVMGWTPDGKNVVFSSTRSTGYPYSFESYTVPADGGQERRLPLDEAKEAYVAPGGKQLVYVSGSGLWSRRGYRGSSNDDLWLANADGTAVKRLTTFDGQDTSPMWSPDGSRVYYVSEHQSPRGCANVVFQDLAAPGSPTALTKHADESVRRARISGNGEWIVYECGADLWVVGTKGAAPRKLAIEVHADDKANTERVTTFTRDATGYALSPDENHAVVVVHGELFLTKLSTPPGKATRLTENPAFDTAPVWSPDGRKVLFSSDRSGVIDLYLLEHDDPDHPEVTRAHKHKATRLTDDRDEETAATFAPNGKKVAFLRSGKLWTMDPDGSGQKPLVEATRVFDYDWSPDGKWIAYARTDGSFASELYLVPADGSAKPQNVSRYATYNGEVTWSQTGGKIGFISQRRGLFAMHVLALQKPAAGAVSPLAAIAASPSDIDWDDLHLRVTRPASMSAESGAISPDGSMVAFRNTTNGDDLWVANADGGGVGRVTSGDQAPRFIQWSKKMPGTIYFLNKNGELRATRANLGFTGPSGPSGEPMKFGFSATLTVRRAEEYAEMFAQSWRLIADGYYDAGHHGTDWKAVRAKYAPLVGHVAAKEDLYALISLMLGELNSSHLGIGGKLPTPDEPTADLGLVFDETFRGPGLKVAEVLKRGPADRRGLGLRAGDVVLAIDGTELAGKANVSRLLNGKVGEAVTLVVTGDPSDPKARRRVEVVAAARTRISQLMYERWVAKNVEQVSKQSNGTIGYIHVPSMDEDGLEQFVRSLYSDNFDKDAVVLDVRYNGGGFTHDAVLNYLSGREHTVFRQRNGGEGLVFRNYDRKWTKPAAVLVNNRSVSDAEIFPHAFRAMGLGKVIGQATGGQVIGTGEVKLIDGSWFNLPRTGIYTTRGVNMEKEGVVPDVPVEMDPADRAKGIDTQLTKSVEVLKADVVAWKKARGQTPPAGGE
jgi:tricorn protease